jgi:hypothetical protein
LPPREPLYYADDFFFEAPGEVKAEEKVENVEKAEKVQIAKEEEKVQKQEVPRQEVSHLAPVSLPAEPPKELVSLPDIAISSLFLKQKRKLVATLTNIGTAPFPMEGGGLSLYVDGRLEKYYTLKSLSDQTLLQPQENIILATPVSIYGRHEVEARVDTSAELREQDKENNELIKILEGLPIGPDIMVKDFELTEDLELNVILSNSGEADLRKGTIFRVRIYLNDRKISDFDHFIPEELKAYSGNLYTLSPPYRASLKGVSKVKVSIAPKLRPDDIRGENNTLERRLILFPFQMTGPGREQFSFYVPSVSLKGDEEYEKITLEARWEGSGTPLKLSFGESGHARIFPDVSGKSPLKIELPIPAGELSQERLWKISVTNPVESRVEGYLIVQHP